MSSLVKVDGILCDEQTDWSSLIAMHLSGSLVWYQRDDPSAVSGLWRLWDSLREHAPELLPRVGRAIAAAAWDSPHAMSVAARFFGNYGGALGAQEFRGALVARWASIPETLPDPLPGGTEPTLRCALLRGALRSYAANETREAALQDLARSEVLQSGSVARAAFVALAVADFPWALQHGPEVLKRHPEAAGDIGLALEVVGRFPPSDVVRWLFQHADRLPHDELTRYIRTYVAAQDRDALLMELKRIPGLETE